MQLEDGDSPAKPEQSGQQLLVDIAVEGTLVNVGVQVDKDSLPGLAMNESDLSVDADILVDSVLLCILGELNGIEVTFLIGSGGSECFLSTAVVPARTSTDSPRSAFAFDSVFFSRRCTLSASNITGDEWFGYIDRKKEQSQFGTTR